MIALSTRTNSMRVAILLLTFCGQIVHANEKLFGAPSGSDVATTPSVGSTGHVTLALLIVLVCVFALAWLLKQMRRLQVGKHSEIAVVSQIALGAKERAVLLKVKNIHLLVGVTAGQVNTLHTFTDFPVADEAATPVSTEQASTAENATTERPSFQAILKRSLGLSQ
jgi:flagellar protein FliO/FliZ